jgi:hypothetical protein
MKFKEDRPLATPDSAERKLLELANAIEADHAGRLSVEIISRQFRDAGGSYEEYGAAVKSAIAHGWITIGSTRRNEFLWLAGPNSFVAALQQRFAIGPKPLNAGGAIGVDDGV